MKKVFFGGSRKLGRLNKELRERIDKVINQNFLVLLGDANGADRAFQQYLTEKSYQNVLVFCAGDTCRNNVGGWKTRHVSLERCQKNFQYYAARDKEMSEEADYGFMLWDGKSKGTLNNIVNMLERDKSVLVYFSLKKLFFTLKSRDDLSGILSYCDRQSLAQLEDSLKLNKRIRHNQPQLKFG
jgi:hypothetical protein